jgi:hypothetical protein
VRHPTDQELLMLAHRAVDPVKAIRLRAHVKRCAPCQDGFARQARLSQSIAGAIRIGLPAWSPLGLGIALRTKVLLAVLAVSVAGFGIKVATERQEVLANSAKTTVCKPGEPGSVVVGIEKGRPHKAQATPRTDVKPD